MRSRLIAVVGSSVVFMLVVVAPAHAAFPSDNGKIAFSAWSGGSTDIYTVNPDGTGLTRLTSDPARDDDPAWSADGRYIAFNRDLYIWVMDADGANQRQVYGPLDYALGRPSWSPGRHGSSRDLRQLLQRRHLQDSHGRTGRPDAGHGDTTRIIRVLIRRGRPTAGRSPSRTTRPRVRSAAQTYTS